MESSPESTPPSVTSTGTIATVEGRKQNLPLAFVAGLAAAILGAAIWAIFTVTTQYQVGYIAIAIGFLVGFGVRLGNGVDRIFGIMGAILALLGCVLGNFLAIVGFAAKAQEMSFVSMLMAIDYTKVPSIMISSFDVMDLVFYGIAIYEGYRFSFRPASSLPLVK